MKITVDPLTAESIPDGTFGGARPVCGGRPPQGGPDPHAAAHRAALEAELSARARRARKAKALSASVSGPDDPGQPTTRSTPTTIERSRP